MNSVTIPDKIRILIVEDEGIVALELQESLEQEGFEVVAVADNAIDAIAIIKKEDIDLILLDIHIKGELDGIQTAIRINQLKNLPIIYLTAYADSETFERAKATKPSAYLIKPFRINDLRRAIDLALFHFVNQTTPTEVKEKTPEKRRNIEQDSILHFNNAIFIKQNYKYNKINVEDIQYLKADGNYTYIQTVEKRHIIKYSLQNIIDILSTDKLVRVHRSFAINMSQLTSFNENQLFLGQEEIPIGRNYKEAFLQLFKSY
ncbi:response regulator [Arcicella lustrica]|uniref:Response regulator n=1 Tax=Arcicella lustrica TaxID=2984196 RepID=A0ABU5SKY3_9BACT|nr:response regulator [Arcicella sp. DC25W]MEA5427963.1 response regulator [Arcicella sp. DC25W]